VYLVIEHIVKEGKFIEDQISWEVVSPLIAVILAEAPLPLAVTIEIVPTVVTSLPVP
jgi:hypothetical protein